MVKKKMPLGPNARFFDDFTEGEELFNSRLTSDLWTCVITLH
jgi:hypothetical protein